MLRSNPVILDSQFENTKTANAERNPRSRLVLYLKLEIPGRLSFLFGGARQAPQTSDCTTKFLRLEVSILLLFFSFTFFADNANNGLLKSASKMHKFSFVTEKTKIYLTS